MNDITVQELNERLSKGETLNMIDVREPHEYEMDHLAMPNMPMGSVPGRVSELSAWKDQEVIVCCRSGGRSGQVCGFLRANGFTNVRNLTGGMLAWKQFINPAFNVQ